MYRQNSEKALLGGGGAGPRPPPPPLATLVLSTSVPSTDSARVYMGRSKTNLSKWGYADAADTACACGTSEQTMQHLLRCPLLENECSLEDLATANEKALHCARAWPNI